MSTTPLSLSHMQMSICLYTIASNLETSKIFYELLKSGQELVTVITQSESTENWTVVRITMQPYSDSKIANMALHADVETTLNTLVAPDAC